VKDAAAISAGACALLFVAAVLGKLDSWAQWSRLTDEIPGPLPLGRAVRVVVPVIESGIVVLSFAHPSIGLATAAFFLLSLAGAVWLLSRILAGRECNCFGVMAPSTITPRLAQRNIALALLAAVGWYLAHNEKRQPLSVSAVVATLLCGGIALVLLQSRKLFVTVRTVSQREEGQ
jgi:hypothetical protein